MMRGEHTEASLENADGEGDRMGWSKVVVTIEGLESGGGDGSMCRYWKGVVE